MLCAKCNRDNPADASFCEQCGSKLELACPVCKAAVSPQARFCRKCGSAIGAAKADAHAAAAPARSQIQFTDDASVSEALDGERKTVTALFADIKGSTEMMEELDPEQARAVIDPALKLMMDAVHHYDGYVVQSTGDGIFALFGALIAHEDHAQRALYASLRMQEELRRYSSKLVADGGTPIQGRIGANTGEVVVRSIQTGAGNVEYTPIGHMTNLAARMQTAAPVGSIAVTEATRNFSEGYFTLKPLGATKVKGVGEPVNVYEVTGLGPLRTRLQRSAGRGLTKFVGRQREMDALKRAAEQARAGRGQLVAAMAEPGVGKSRLFFEFKAVASSGWMVLETFSVSHGKASGYLPVLDLLSAYFRIASDDDPRTRREKVTGRVLALDRSLEDTLPYLFGLLGIFEGADPHAQMDPQVRKRRTLDAIKRMLLRESLNQPLMAIFEDLHWIDEESQALLNLLADSIGTAKILLLVNYRPEYSHQWNSKTYYSQLRLDPLGKESAGEMLSALLGGGEDLAPLKRLIIERTEGNPFFMEETVLVLLDEGALVRNGATRLAKPLSELKIPPTVQAILASRIDRLPADQKDLLQTLAVIGKEFPLSLAREVTKKPGDELNRMLNHLQLAEFIYEQPAVGDLEYTFKHALTQEVAYNSVLIERRKALHGRAGAAIESLYANELDERVVELAHHYGRSGNVSKSLDYLGKAARQAVTRGAYADAASFASQAIGLVRELDAPDLQRLRRELAFRMILGQMYAFIHGPFSEMSMETHARARDIALTVGDEETLFAALGRLRAGYALRGEIGAALDLSRELLSLAERSGDSTAMVAARVAAASTLSLAGEFEAAQEHYDAAMAGGSAGPGSELGSGVGVDFRIITRAEGAVNLWNLGYADRAEICGREALVLAREGSDPFHIQLALVHLCRVQRERGDFAELSSNARELAAVAAEHGLVAGRIGDLFQAEAVAETGDANALSIARDAFYAGLPMAIRPVSIVASIFLKLGRLDEGLDAVGRALRDAERTGARASEAELHRMHGELLVRRDQLAGAEIESCFRTAIDVARRQKARSYELRATTSLARLLAKQGKRDEARAMLSEIYNWFTEGFDTADLKDAKALLGELSAAQSAAPK